MSTLAHLKLAVQSMQNADASITLRNRNETATAALHTAMFYLEIAIFNTHETDTDLPGIPVRMRDGTESKEPATVAEASRADGHGTDCAIAARV